MPKVKDLIAMCEGHDPEEEVVIHDSTPRSYQIILQPVEAPVNSVEAETIQEEPKAEEGVA